MDEKNSQRIASAFCRESQCRARKLNIRFYRVLCAQSVHRYVDADHSCLFIFVQFKLATTILETLDCRDGAWGVVRGGYVRKMCVLIRVKRESYPARLLGSSFQPAFTSFPSKSGVSGLHRHSSMYRLVCADNVVAGRSDSTAMKKSMIRDICREEMPTRRRWCLIQGCTSTGPGFDIS